MIVLETGLTLFRRFVITFFFFPLDERNNVRGTHSRRSNVIVPLDR